MTELGCKGYTGINVIAPNRLVCKLKIGNYSNFEVPQIIITGYEVIPAGTPVTILITKVRTLILIL